MVPGPKGAYGALCHWAAHKVSTGPYPKRIAVPSTSGNEPCYRPGAGCGRKGSPLASATGLDTTEQAQFEDQRGAGSCRADLASRSTHLWWMGKSMQLLKVVLTRMVAPGHVPGVLGSEAQCEIHVCTCLHVGVVLEANGCRQ